MASKHTKEDRGPGFVRIKKVVTLAELVLHLHCSRRTVQRRLADWQAIRSYNRNGSYYSHRSPPPTIAPQPRPHAPPGGEGGTSPRPRATGA